MNSHIKGRLFPDFSDFLVNLATRPIHHFFNTRWMNPAVLNQFLQSQLSNLTSNWVKTT